MDGKNIIIKLLGIGAVILFFWYSISSDSEREKEIDKIGLEDLNLQLTGVVHTMIKGRNYHGYGIIRLRIINSNITSYDPRSKLKYYYCVIKDGMAEIYDHTFIDKVDTVIIDTKKKKKISFRDGEEKVEDDISINPTDAYYDFIKEKTMFK